MPSTRSRTLLALLLPVVTHALAFGTAECVRPGALHLGLRARSARCCAQPLSDLPGVRVNKVFTSEFSRREADRLVTDGRVTINGVVAKAGDRVEAGDQVELDGRPFAVPTVGGDGGHELAPPPGGHIYLKYWKPRGITCTTDRRVRGNVIDALGDLPARAFPVRRVSEESTRSGQLCAILARRHAHTRVTQRCQRRLDAIPKAQT